jgi:Big-like domain-containing protein
LTPALTAADEFCPRTISFTIPGAGPGNPGVQVTAVEHQENGVKTGTIDFTVDVLGNADLRGLFFQFNEAHLNGLTVTGGDGLITNKLIQANSVIDLGQGAEMHGAASPFDVGIKWGTPGPNPDFINFPVHFTLSNAANNLTLDDIAHQEFGVKLGAVKGPDAKLTTIAPAAPDAVNDNVPPNSIFEDGASGFGDPSHVPLGKTGLIEVLANDTDADGDKLTITDLHGVQHGTLQIVDGSDADLLPGDAILYTPDTDYSGPDSFLYCVSDGHGGQDNATVNLNVEAVADVPDLQVSVVQGDEINVYLVNVTATQTDLDGSEFIDRISWTVPGGVPADVSITPVGDVNPGDEPDQIVQQFVVTVPLGQDTKFDLDITAVSKEVSNGDTEQATVAVPIELDFTHNTAQETFSTTNQSIWDPSLPAAFNDERFLGFHDADSAKVDIELASAGGSYDITIGFQSTLHATLGDIEATLPYDITIDTTYNVTTDSLLIDPSAVLDPSAHFTTHGPGGSYNLDFVCLAELSAFLHNPIHDFDKSVSVDLGFPILDIDSATFTKTIDIPPVDPVATLTLNWPHSIGESTLETNGAPVDADTLHSDGTSLDIVNLDRNRLGLRRPRHSKSARPRLRRLTSARCQRRHRRGATLRLELGPESPRRIDCPRGWIVTAVRLRQSAAHYPERVKSRCQPRRQDRLQSAPDAGCNAAQRNRSRLPRRRRPQSARLRRSVRRAVFSGRRSAPRRNPYLQSGGLCAERFQLAGRPLPGLDAQRRPRRIVVVAGGPGQKALSEHKKRYPRRR